MRIMSGNIPAQRNLESFVVATAIVLMVIPFFGLNTPLNLSTEAASRWFTSYKLGCYAFALLTAYLLVIRQAGLVFRVRGLVWAGCLLASYSLSTVYARYPDLSLQQLRELVASISMYVVTAILFASFTRLDRLLRILLYIGLAVVLIARAAPSWLFSLLPSSNAAQALLEGIASQTATTGTGGDFVRVSLPWLDANNFGYLLGFLSILTRYVQMDSRVRSMAYAFYSAVLGVLLALLLQTVSRGATLSTVLGIAIVGAWPRKGATPHKMRGAMLMCIALLMLIGLSAVSESGRVVQARFQMALNAVGLGASASEYSGLESGRLETAMLAIRDFRERPIIGWGGGPAGEYSSTSNHLHYLNLLAEWGIVGFTLYVLFAVEVARRLRGALLVVRKKGSNHEVGLGYAILAVLVAVVVKGLFARWGSDLWMFAGMAMAYSNAAKGVASGGGQDGRRVLIRY